MKSLTYLFKFYSNWPYTSFSEFLKSPLHIAVENENIELIQILLESSNININSLASYWSKRYFGYTYGIFKSEKTALHIAFEEKNIKVIELLLSRPEIDVYIIVFSNMCEKYDHEIKTTVLNMAVEYGIVQMVKLLLDNKNIAHTCFLLRFICWEYHFQPFTLR